MTSSGDPGAEDAAPHDEAEPGRSHPAPAGSGAPFPDVVDFDLLATPVPQQASQVVDFDALVATSPDADADADAGSGRAPLDAGELQRTVLPATAAEVSVLADEGAAVDVAVVDIASASRRSATAEPRRARRSRPERPDRTSPPTAGQLGSRIDDSGHGGDGGGRAGSAAESDEGCTDDRDDDRGATGPGRRASKRSTFGDGASRSFGGRSRGGRAGNRRPRTEWGIQLDAEVDEPTAHAAGAPEAAGDGSVPPEQRTEHDRARSRGRAGSFGRPRRAAGEPAPEYEDPEQAARQICLTALTGAARTRQQLAELLAAKEVPADAAESVLERFTEVGLIDDAAFAAAWVSSRQSGRGLSRRALADELRRKGVDKEVAAVALEAVDPQDEWDAARALVARKVPGMRRLDHATATRRLTALLGRKGYGAGLSAWVVREALEADGKAEDAAAEADDAPPDLGAGEGPQNQGSAPVRRGLWSGRPLDEAGEPVAEVGEGLGLDGWARTRSARQRPR